MFSDCSVILAHENCDWTGSLIATHVQRRGLAEIVTTDRAWFRCPHCQQQWEVQVSDFAVDFLPGVERSVEAVGARRDAWG